MRWVEFSAHNLRQCRKWALRRCTFTFSFGDFSYHSFNSILHTRQPNNPPPATFTRQNWPFSKPLSSTFVVPCSDLANVMSINKAATTKQQQNKNKTEKEKSLSCCFKSCHTKILWKPCNYTDTLRPMMPDIVCCARLFIVFYRREYSFFSLSCCLYSGFVSIFFHCSSPASLHQWAKEKSEIHAKVEYFFA